MQAKYLDHTHPFATDNVRGTPTCCVITGLVIDTWLHAAHVCRNNYVSLLALSSKPQNEFDSSVLLK